MKLFISILLFVSFGVGGSVNANEFNSEQFAKGYFNAWAATQAPMATSRDVENYLSLLTEDIGHQHLPYDPDGTRSPDGKRNMRKGMNYYLGAHTEYLGTLTSHTYGHDVIVIKYETLSKGIHPQTKKTITLNHRTLEVLEIENGKVSVIRKYSE